MRRFRVASLSLLLTLGLFLSCTDGEGPVSFEAAGIVASIQIQPVIPPALLTSAAQAKPINLIRVTVTTSPGGQQVAALDFVVEPNASEWALPVEIPLSDDPAVRYVLTIELINREGGQEEVQWSARTDPLRVTPGGTNSNVRRVEVVRGPVENLSVVSLTLTGPASVPQGDGFELDAQVQVNDNSGSPTIFFTSLTPDIASIDDNGDGVALSPGLARIQAEAGPVSAIHEFEVIGVSHEIVIDPQQIVLNGLGEVAEFMATVVDINGVDRGESVAWSVDDDRVAVHLGEGRFEAIGGGETFVTATGVESPDLSVSADLVVDLLPVALEVRPSALTLTALGQTAELEAVGIDAAGGEIFGLDVDFASGDETVAEVDSNGRVTAVGPGTTTINATSTADEASAVSGQGTSALISADVVVTVRQDVAELVIDPTEVSVDAIGKTVQFGAEAFDAEGTPIAEPELSWRSDDGAVATVTQDGLATAVGRGQTEIFVEANDVSVSAVFNVDLQITRIVITPAQVITTPGGTVQYDATLFNGDVVVDGITVAWKSSKPSVGTIDAVSGKATGVAVGATDITASFGGITSNVARLFVENRIPTALAFANEPGLVGSGLTIKPPIRVKAVSNDGSTVDNYSGEISIGLYSPPLVSGRNGQAVEIAGPLTGTLTKQAQNGVATFDDLIFSTTGTFQFQALTMDDLDPAITSPFDVLTPSADLDLDKTVDPAIVEENGTVTFQVIITNNGPFPAELISVAETIPGNLGSVVVTPSKGTWTGSFWEIPTLAPGEVQTLTITGTAQGEPGSTINNSAYIYESDPFDPDSDNDFASVSATVNGAPFVDDVTISVPPDEPTTISIPVSEPDGDALSAGAIDSGPSDGSVGPVVLVSNAEVQVTYTPNSGFLGTDNFTLTVTDEHGAVSNVGSVDITVASGPANVSYETGGNTELITGSYTRPGTGHVFVGDGVLATTPGLTVTTTGALATVEGGTVDMQAGGGFSYRPPLGWNGTDTFDYTVDTGQTATVTITVAEMVWYVNNLAGAGNGTGTSWDPFGELSMAEGSPPGAPPRVQSPGEPARVSAGGDVIFVHAGDGTTTGYNAGIVLLDGQSLFGEGSGLIGDGMDGAPDWGTVVAPGTPPKITNPLGSAIQFGSDNDVGGLTVDNPLAAGLFVQASNNARAFDVTILGGSVGIALDAVTGDALFDNVTIDGSTFGIDVTAGTPNAVYHGTILNVSDDIVRTDLQSGGVLHLLDGPFQSVEGGGIFLQAFGGSFQIDNARLDTTSRGLTLTNVSGSFLFNGIEIVDAAGSAIDVTNLSGSGVITLQTQFVNNTGLAVDVSGVTAAGSLTIDGPVDMDDFGNGVTLVGVDGHVGIQAPLFLEQQNFSLTTYIASGTGTVDIDDLTVTSPAPAPVSPGGYAPPESRVAMGSQPTAIYVTGQSGTTTFGMTNIDVTDAQGVFISGSGTVRFPAPGPHNLNVVNERAFFGGSSNLDVTFNSLSSDGGFGDAIRLDNATGTFETQGGSITNHGGDGFESNSSIGVDVTLGTNITTPIGSGRSVNIGNSASSSFTFNGLVSERGLGISLNGNSGASASFDGGLILDTSAGPGLFASSSGTLEITGSTNTVNTTGQAGIDISSTSIGPGGITFQSISVDGATGNGINLSNVSGPGTFEVAGTGAPGSGGTIQNNGGTGGVAIFNNDAPVTLRDAIIQSNTGNGISAFDVGTLTIDNTTISGNGVSHPHHRGIWMSSPTGTVTITNSTVSSSDGDGIFTEVISGTGHLEIKNSTISGNGGAGGIVTTGPLGSAGNLTLDIDGNSISGQAFSPGINLNVHNSQMVDARIINNAITGNATGIRIDARGTASATSRIGVGGPNTISSNSGHGIHLFGEDSGITNSLISGNTISSNGGGIFNETPTTFGPSGVFNVDIQSNTVDGTSGGGILNDINGDGMGIIRIENNTLQNVGGGDGIRTFVGSSPGPTPTLEHIIVGNTVRIPALGSGDGIHNGTFNTGIQCLNLDSNNFPDPPPVEYYDVYGGFFPSGGGGLFVQGLGGSTTDAAVIETLFGTPNNTGADDVFWTLPGSPAAGPGSCTAPPALSPFIPN